MNAVNQSCKGTSAKRDEPGSSAWARIFHTVGCALAAQRGALRKFAAASASERPREISTRPFDGLIPRHARNDSEAVDGLALAATCAVVFGPQRYLIAV